MAFHGGPFLQHKGGQASLLWAQLSFLHALLSSWWSMSFLSGDSNPGPNSSAFPLSPDILYPAALTLLLSLCLKTLQNKRQSTKWEKISAKWCNQQGLTSNMYEQPTQLSNENPTEMGIRPKQTLFHVYRHTRRCSVSLTALEKCKSKL